MWKEKPIIEIRSLSKTFRGKNAEVHALQDINPENRTGGYLRHYRYERAGKSTLVRCMIMLEIPTEGTVLFDGMDLSKLNRKQLREARRSMGMIFQQFNLLMQRTCGSEHLLHPWKSPGWTRRPPKSAQRSFWNSSVCRIKRSLIPPSSPAGKSSVLQSPARWPPIQRCSCVTKRRPPWTPIRRPRFWLC